MNAIPKIRELYVAATRNQWNPERDIDWNALDPDAIPDEQREAALGVEAQGLALP